MDEIGSRDVPFRRIGGFAPFPFFPSKLSIGEFQVIWKNWILFDIYEVRRHGTLYLKTRPGGAIISRNGPSGYIKESVSTETEGTRIKALYAGIELSVECEVINKGSSNEKMLFKVFEGQSRIGAYSWSNGNGEVITGHTLEGKSDRLWFWGLSLMKLWRKERDRQMAGYQ